MAWTKAKTIIVGEASVIRRRHHRSSSKKSDARVPGGFMAFCGLTPETAEGSSVLLADSPI